MTSPYHPSWRDRATAGNGLAGAGLSLRFLPVRYTIAVARAATRLPDARVPQSTLRLLVMPCSIPPPFGPPPRPC